MKKILSVFLVSVMLLSMGISSYANELDTNSCSHTWSSWSTIKSWYDDGETIFDCYQLVNQQLRYCTKCNDTQMRETRNQLQHIWKGSKCSRCGVERTDVRKLDK